MEASAPSFIFLSPNYTFKSKQKEVKGKGRKGGREKAGGPRSPTLHPSSPCALPLRPLEPVLDKPQVQSEDVVMVFPSLLILPPSAPLRCTESRQT